MIARNLGGLATHRCGRGMAAAWYSNLDRGRKKKPIEDRKPPQSGYNKSFRKRGYINLAGVLSLWGFLVAFFADSFIQNAITTSPEAQTLITREVYLEDVNYRSA